MEQFIIRGNILFTSQKEELRRMAKPVCMVPGKELPDAAEDFRGAKRIEQYRISEKALYLPEGLRWKYLPFSAIDKAEESFRVISAGHCVPVREKRPELDLSVGSETVHLQLEKAASMQTVVEVLKAASIL